MPRLVTTILIQPDIELLYSDTIQYDREPATPEEAVQMADEQIGEGGCSYAVVPADSDEAVYRVYEVPEDFVEGEPLSERGRLVSTLSVARPAPSP